MAETDAFPGPDDVQNIRLLTFGGGGFRRRGRAFPSFERGKSYASPILLVAAAYPATVHAYQLSWLRTCGEAGRLATVRFRSSNLQLRPSVVFQNAHRITKLVCELTVFAKNDLEVLREYRVSVWLDAGTWAKCVLTWPIFQHRATHLPHNPAETLERSIARRR